MKEFVEIVKILFSDPVGAIWTLFCVAIIVTSAVVLITS